MPIRLKFLIASCALVLLSMSVPVRAQTARPAAASGSVAPPAAAAAPVLDGKNLQTFFAGLVPYALKQGDIAGAAIAVVKDGKLIFAQGYGYADKKTQTPVVADKTLFRVGSVSKLFTWTAVMQLVQAGKIDLDRNVNDYLDFKIPPKFGKPITMRDLMTHTPGFAQVSRDLFVPSPKQLFPLRSYLVRNMPKRIFPPGKIGAYSNYGAALAGYIVQRVSGEPFDQYVEDHILKPLEMEHSTFRQPLPRALQPDMSKGYLTASSGRVIPFQAVEAYPAGALSAPVTDMAHFMIAQLQQGNYNGASILSPATVKLMHSPQYRPAPGLNAMDLGFYQENRNGLQIIGHAGDTQAFHSYLHLIQGADVGIFLAFNSTGRNGGANKARRDIYHRFLDHYFPYTAAKEKTVAHPQRDAARVAGWYVISRRDDLGISLLGQTHISALPGGSIRVGTSSRDMRFREVGPLAYRKVNGQMQLKFVAAPDGRIRYWAISPAPMVVFQRVHGLKQFGLVKALSIPVIVILALTLVIWFGGWMIRRHYKQVLVLDRRTYWLRLASRIGVVLMLVVVVAWLLANAWASQQLTSVMATSFASVLVVLYVLGVLGIAGAVAVIAGSLWRVVKGPGSIVCRTGEALLALSAIYGLWFIFAFGLASFNTHY